MALKTNINGERGTQATYTRIAWFKPNFIQKTTEVGLYAYTDKQERDNYEAEPVACEAVTIPTTNHLDRVLESRAEIYTELTTGDYTVSEKNEEGENVEKIVPRYPNYYQAEEI